MVLRRRKYLKAVIVQQKKENLEKCRLDGKKGRGQINFNSKKSGTYTRSNIGRENAISVPIHRVQCKVSAPANNGLDATENGNGVEWVF
jgi:hypothetical protein